MKFRRLLLCGIVIGALASCDQPNSKKPTIETLVFDVDSTRLEPAIKDATLNIKMAAPKGWKAIDESMLGQVIDGLGEKFTRGFQMVPQWVFLNERTRAMCAVSRLEGAEGIPDETALESLEAAYRDEFPKASIQRAIFMKDAFRVNQLMVVTSSFVLIRLICDAPENPVFEVNYVVPRGIYEAELRSIESSIGSINLITN